MHIILPYAVALVVALLVIPGFLPTRKSAFAWTAAYFLGIVLAVFGLLYGVFMMLVLSASLGPSFLTYLKRSLLVITTQYRNPGMFAVIEPFLLVIGNALVIPVFIRAIIRVQNQKN